MKYYLVEIATGDSTIAGKAVYEYETEKEAVAQFHQKYGNAINSNKFQTELLAVICGNGDILERATYDKDKSFPERSI